MRQTSASELFQIVTIGDGQRIRIVESFEQRLRPFVCRTYRMEPQRHVSLGEDVGHALAKAQRSALDGP